MGKKLKDYLHFYIGCKAQLPEGTIVIIEGIYKNDGNTYAKCLVQDSRSDINGVDMSYMVDALKPILRQLSDMTLFDGIDLGYKGDMDLGEWIQHRNKITIWNPTQFHYLLSKHFDLYDLIKEGLAIDATTLKQKPFIEFPNYGG
jgi:hypothetical protein